MGYQWETRCLFTLAPNAPYRQQPRDHGLGMRCLSMDLWPVPPGTQGFCYDEPGRDALCAIQHDFSPLHHSECVDCLFGPTCTALGSRQFRHFDMAMRFSSQGAPQVQRCSWDFSGSSRCTCPANDISVLLAKDAIEPFPPAEMKSGFYSPRGPSQGFHRAQERRWPSVNPGSVWLESGPSQAPIQDVDVEAHHQMHPAPGLVCSGRPVGHLLSCLDSSLAQAIAMVCK